MLHGHRVGNFAFAFEKCPVVLTDPTTLTSNLCSSESIAGLMAKHKAGQHTILFSKSEIDASVLHTEY